MAKTVWKATLTKQINAIDVPVGATILTAMVQFEQPCVWFWCDPTAEKETRRIAVCATGGPAPDDGNYIGSVMLQGGALVFHIFEEARTR